MLIARQEAIARFGSYWRSGSVIKPGSHISVRIAEVLGIMPEQVISPDLPFATGYFRSLEEALNTVQGAAEQNDLKDWLNWPDRSQPYQPVIAPMPDHVRLIGYHPPDTTIYIAKMKSINEGFTVSPIQIGDPTIEPDINDSGQYECLYRNCTVSGKAIDEAKEGGGELPCRYGQMYGLKMFVSQDLADAYADSCIHRFLSASGPYGAKYLKAAELGETSCN